MENPRKDILNLFQSQKQDSPPLFSGLISVTAQGLKQDGLKFHEVHQNGPAMAQAASSTFRLSGFGSAVVPLDLCVEAEALGAQIDFREENDPAEYPRVAEFLYTDIMGLITWSKKYSGYMKSSVDLLEAQGRIPLAIEAINLLKEDIGRHIVIGAYAPGPFTLLSLLVETGALYLALRKAPEQVHTALEFLSRFLAIVGKGYHNAGADFITIHEMGGSPGALGPKVFNSVVLPHLQALISELPSPIVLSACGRTNGAMKLLAASRADALSVDQTNDLKISRQEVQDVLLFGNLDPVKLISQGTPDEISKTVERVVNTGVDAVWPGCDLHLDVPLENLQSLTKAFK